MRISKGSDHEDPHKRIKSIGGVKDHVRWWRPEGGAITDIESGAFEYFVLVATRPIEVVVAVHEGRKYLKTKPDDYVPNNLLSQPECP